MYLFIGVDNRRTAKLYLISPGDGRVRASKSWAADRRLSHSLLANVDALLRRNGLGWEDLGGLGVFAGPAGFTDLRVAHAFANALAYGRRIPVVNAGGRRWRHDCWQRLTDGFNARIIKPRYGRPAPITRRKK